MSAGPPFRRFDPGLAAIAALPLLMLAVHEQWIYTTPCDIDAWYSFGYFLHLPDHLRNYPGVYTESRLAWILPGRLFHSALPPIPANLCLHLTYCWVALFAMYGIIRPTLGRRTAVVTTLLMGSYAYFLEALGWNYVDGAGITYMLLTALAVTKSRTSQRRPLCLFLAGVAAAAAVHSNLFLTTFLPGLAAYHIVGAADRSLRKLAADAAIAFAGSLLLTMALACASTAYGGEFLFFAVSFKAAGQIAVHKMAESASVPFGTWFPRSHWLRLPMFVSLAACVYLLCARRGLVSAGPIPRFFQWWFLYNAAVLTFFQWNRNPTLMGSWYASYLIPSLFLALAGQLSAVLNAMPRTTAFVAAAAGPAVSAALLLLLPVGPAAVSDPDPAWQTKVAATLGKLQGHLAGTLPQMVIPALLIGLIVCARRVPRLAGPATLMLLSLLGTVSFGGFFMNAYPPGFKHDTYLAIRRSSDVITTANADNRRIRFWFADPDHHMGCVFRALNSVFLWQRARFSTRFPEIGADRPEPGSFLIVVSTGGGVTAQAAEALKPLGLSVRARTEERVAEGQVSLVLTILEVAGIGGADNHSASREAGRAADNL